MIDLTATYAIIGTAAAFVGGYITIPRALMNGIQKKMTQIDNWLNAEEAKDPTHQAMWVKIKGDLDDTYTQIANGTISVMGAIKAAKDIADAYEQFKTYEVPVIKVNLETEFADLKAEIKSTLASIVAANTPASTPSSTSNNTSAPVTNTTAPAVPASK